MLSVLIFVLLIFSSASEAISAESQKLDRVRIGYSSISSSRIALWVASDMGFFKKNGLAAEAIVTPGVQGTQALIAGELQFYLGGVDSAALAAARGSDLVVLATAEPIEYKLITQPNVKTVKEVRGKKIVVDRVGGTSYYISLQILEKVGLKTGDVELVQVGGGGNQRVAAFKSGLVAGVVTSPDRFEQLKIPYHVLADAMELGIKVMGNSYLTTRSFRDQNKDVVLRTMKSLVQGRRWAKDPKNRQEVLRIYNRYLPSPDASFMDHLYRKNVESMPLYPYTNIEDLRIFLSYLGDANPNLRNVKLAEFVDNSYLKRIEQETGS
ncbi:MAG TPA: ABC transporter substrate-binding protein [Candidatus Binatia bacterium]|nr:ABC transporter substrate-binding protein [Candidatus Binatia bacterium]